LDPDDAEIKVVLSQILTELQGIHTTLQEDRKWLWRILALALLGAFALVGLKMALPA
jgi:hypothetical protein